MLKLRYICRLNISASVSMSSKKSGKMKKGNNSTNDKVESAEISKEPNAISVNQNGNIVLRIHAKPGAKQNTITNISTDAIGVQIAAPPVDGEANTELVKYIAKTLQLRKSDVTVDRGSKSREKILLIYKDASIDIDRAIDLLKSECQS